MKIEVREDSVLIEGYVNAIERKSKPLWSRIGQFIERICKGAFDKALKRNNNVRILLNHDWNRDLGGTADGNLELCEDNIGLRARATITDSEVIDKARSGDLVGWSFGFKDRDVFTHEVEGMPMRDVKDLDLYEVSILDKTKTPAYDGTLVTVRAEEEDIINLGDVFFDGLEVREAVSEKSTEAIEEVVSEVSEEESTLPEIRDDEPKQHENVEENKFDYAPYEDILKKMKQEDA